MAKPSTYSIWPREVWKAATQAERVAMVDEFALGSLDDPERLLVLLEHPHDFVRARSVCALERQDTPAIRAFMRAAMTDPDKHVRTTAADAIGLYRDGRDIIRLTIALAGDPSWFVRSSAADALGTIGHRSAAPALKAALRYDSAPIVRRNAAAALVAVRAKHTHRALVEALAREHNAFSRIGISIGLYTYGDRAARRRLHHAMRSGDRSILSNIFNFDLADYVRQEDYDGFRRRASRIMETHNVEVVRDEAAAFISRLDARLLPAA
ncbi:MAG: HEAT repeat domain-containing protein [Armatimonadetes bacterium]|nr:HEAT repeat domain-containing protein [Armatimonadota bacterium]MDE2206167.1 HEAT repeat domain-containing protein [Armatimonadota bacterium]